MNEEQRNDRPKGEQNRKLNGWTVILLLIAGFLVVFGLVRLIDSALQQQESRKTDEEMRALYHTPTPDPTLTPVPTDAPEPTPQFTKEAIQGQDTEMPVSETVAETEMPTPTPTPVPRLEEQEYSGNPGRNVGTRFQALRKENKDIIGWLTIGKMVDEAVVQRDNEYYMNHNVKKQDDVSGAIFLDALVSLDTRPYALILYGHNMKTGARFGSLRNFENQHFYHKYPFISFDTLYEEGKYVIFSVGLVSTDENDSHYLDFFALNSRRIDERQQAIDTLQSVSLYSNEIDIRPDDQILLLVTCVEKDTDRRIVAARRIRDGEEQKTLKKLAENSRRK